MLNAGPFAGVGAAPAGWPMGASVDQRIAEGLAVPTKLRSLELGVQVGAADNWGRMIYRAANQPLPPDDDPASVYARVFSDLHTDPAVLARLRRRRKSILDGVGAQFSRTSSRLGSSDRQRLDAHLTAVREIETRLTTDLVVNNPSCHDPTITPVSASANDAFPATGALQMDLMTMALACDITRVASMQWSRSVSQTRFTWLNITEGHHDLSHRPDGDPAGDKLIDINHWYAPAVRGAHHPPQGDARRRRRHAVRQHAAALVQRAGQGQHARPDGRALRAGRRGGRLALRTGRFLRYDGQGLPHNNLLVSILNAMGVPDRILRQARLVHGTAGRTYLEKQERHMRRAFTMSSISALALVVSVAGTSGCGSNPASFPDGGGDSDGAGGSDGGDGRRADDQLRRHQPGDRSDRGHRRHGDARLHDRPRRRPQRRLVGGRR